jgi:hypothetical protein
LIDYFNYFNLVFEIIIGCFIKKIMFTIKKYIFVKTIKRYIIKDIKFRLKIIFSTYFKWLKFLINFYFSQLVIK